MSMAISAMANAASPQVMSGASMRMPPAQKMSNLFDQIDTTGSGTITKAQFDQAFQSMSPPGGMKSMGADAVWSKLDPNGTGSVSKQDFINGMASVRSSMHAHHHHGSGNSTQTPSHTAGQSLNALSTLGTSSSRSTTGSNIDTAA